jgi:hypothetical protein
MGHIQQLQFFDELRRRQGERVMPALIAEALTLALLVASNVIPIRWPGDGLE